MKVWEIVSWGGREFLGKLGVFLGFGRTAVLQLTR